MRRLQDADLDFGAVGGDADVGAGKAARDVPEDAEGAPGAGFAGDGEAEDDEEDQWRKQDGWNPEQEERNPERGMCANGASRCGQWLCLESFKGLQFADGFGGGDLAAVEPIEDFGAGGRGVVVDEVKLAGDAVEPRFDGGIANAEGLLHLLDGAVGAEESDDEDLVF